MLLILSLMCISSQSTWNSFLVRSGPTWACSLLVGTASRTPRRCHQNREIAFHRHLPQRGETPRIASCQPQAKGWTVFAECQGTHCYPLTCWCISGPPMCVGRSAEEPQTSPSYPGCPARFSTLVFVLSSNLRCAFSLFEHFCTISAFFLSKWQCFPLVSTTWQGETTDIFLCCCLQVAITGICWCK